MTFEEIKAKIKACDSISITGIKEIQYGKCICLSNGGKINCFDTGKYSVQGKPQAQTQVKAILEKSAETNNRKIFVVYGHDRTARAQLELLLRRWGLDPIILDQQASGGQTIIEKLEEYGSDVGYAIILATPDDDGKAKSEEKYKSRVRQNVVLEMGMFLAKLGRERVAILLKETADFEKPSDIQGLVYIPFRDQVEDASISLIRELNQQGYKIDSEKI